MITSQKQRKIELWALSKLIIKIGGLSMVYGYCRVSTKGQAKDGNSIEAQEAAVREAGAEERCV